MVRSLTLDIIISIVFLIGCCKTPNDKIQEQEAVKPIWKQELIIGNSDKIWNNGLLTPIVYGDKIVIFHTTLHHSSNSEDNRLCGININDGNIKWLFPSDTSAYYDYCFDGSAYIYNQTLFTRSVSFAPRNDNEVLAINLTTQNVEFKKELPFNDWDRNCYGKSEYLAWEENTKTTSSIYLMNIETQDVQIIRSNHNVIGFDMKYSIVDIKDGCIIFFEQGYNDKEYGKYLCVFDISTMTMKSKYKIDINFDGFLLYKSLLEDNVVYSVLGKYILAISIKTGDVIWKTDINEAYNFYCNDIVICYDKLFLGGENMYALMDKTTGQILYKKKVDGCKWFTQYNGYIYINQMNRISIVDPKNGDILAYIEAENESEVFNIGNKASFYDNKMFVMSYTTAYCYPTYPWK